METNAMVRAKEYYTLVGAKNENFKKFLHPDVELYGPMATLKGKEAVFQATSNFTKMFKTLNIRAKFGAADQAMLVYEIDIPGKARIFLGRRATFSRWLDCQNSVVL